MSSAVGWQEREVARQRTMTDYRLGRLSAEASFNAVTELAADLFDVPISAVTVLGAEQQMLPGVYGLDAREWRPNGGYTSDRELKSDLAATRF